MGHAIKEDFDADLMPLARDDDPIRAAQERAGILAGLRRDRTGDARVQAVFDADPIVAEEISSGNLVTQSMLDARLAVFDAVLEILGRPALTNAARARIIFTLRGAFPVLTDDAQVEWALSEVRNEEIKAFLASRTAEECEAVARQIAVMADQTDLWVAARTLSMAAHVAVGRERGAARLSELLELREA